jgi:hypothetical protein
MTSTPSPVWPAVATTTTTPPASPRPIQTGRGASAAALAAVAIVGVVIGFAGGRAIDHTPNLSTGLAGITRALQTPSNPPAVSNTTPPAASSSNPGTGAAQPGTAANAGTGSNAAPSGQPGAAAGRGPQRGQRGNPGANPANPANPGNPAANAGNPAAAAAPGTPASAADQTAIQQAIQGIDDAQTKAVASKDMSGLTANATSDFATQQKSVTQDLVNNGVTEIKLVNIEWGPITVNGNTATATAYETWSTTYSDSSTEQSRDQNVYTLVQQDGTWKVQTDEHPDAQGGLPNGLNSIPGLNNVVPPGLLNPFPNKIPQPQGSGHSGGVHA